MQKIRTKKRKRRIEKDKSKSESTVLEEKINRSSNTVESKMGE